MRDTVAKTNHKLGGISPEFEDDEAAQNIGQ